MWRACCPTRGGFPDACLSPDGRPGSFQTIGHRVALGVKPLPAALTVIPPLRVATVDVPAVVHAVPPFQGAQRLGIRPARQPLSSEAELTDIARTTVGTGNEKRHE